MNKKNIHKKINNYVNKHNNKKFKTRSSKKIKNKLSNIYPHHKKTDKIKNKHNSMKHHNKSYKKVSNIYIHNQEEKKHIIDKKNTNDLHRHEIQNHLFHQNAKNHIHNKILNKHFHNKSFIPGFHFHNFKHSLHFRSKNNNYQDNQLVLKSTKYTTRVFLLLSILLFFVCVAIIIVAGLGKIKTNRASGGKEPNFPSINPELSGDRSIYGEKGPHLIPSVNDPSPGSDYSKNPISSMYFYNIYVKKDSHGNYYGDPYDINPLNTGKASYDGNNMVYNYNYLFFTKDTYKMPSVDYNSFADSSKQIKSISDFPKEIAGSWKPRIFLNGKTPNSDISFKNIAFNSKTSDNSLSLPFHSGLYLDGTNPIIPTLNKTDKNKFFTGKFAHDGTLNNYDFIGNKTYNNYHPNKDDNGNNTPYGEFSQVNNDAKKREDVNFDWFTNSPSLTGTNFSKSANQSKNYNTQSAMQPIEENIVTKILDPSLSNYNVYLESKFTGTFNIQRSQLVKYDSIVPSYPSPYYDPLLFGMVFTISLKVSLFYQNNNPDNPDQSIKPLFPTEDNAAIFTNLFNRFDSEGTKSLQNTLRVDLEAKDPDGTLGPDTNPNPVNTDVDISVYTNKDFEPPSDPLFKSITPDNNLVFLKFQINISDYNSIINIVSNKNSIIFRKNSI